MSYCEYCISIFDALVLNYRNPHALLYLCFTSFLVLLQHLVCNIWYICSCKTLSSNVELFESLAKQHAFAKRFSLPSHFCHTSLVALSGNSWKNKSRKVVKLVATCVMLVT
jgi:hypothetical protein